MESVEKRVCPVDHAGILNNVFRRWLQNPVKILNSFIDLGMTVMDYGCGPGFFTLDLAQMVGEAGKVIAVDLQEGMLEKLDSKLLDSELKDRIQLHRCTPDRIGISEKVDFVLAFYVVHEIPDQAVYFRELASVLQPTGAVLVVEPPFHVSKAAFKETVQEAKSAGFIVHEGPKVALSKSVVLRK